MNDSTSLPSDFPAQLVSHQIWIALENHRYRDLEGIKALEYINLCQFDTATLRVMPDDPNNSIGTVLNELEKNLGTSELTLNVQIYSEDDWLWIMEDFMR